jgi:HEAT repeat protein
MRRLHVIALVLLVAGCARSAKKDYSVTACIRNLEDKDPDVRYTAVSVLGSYGPEAREAVPALTKALRDPDKHVRTGVAYALAEIGADARSAIPALVEASKDRDADVRSAANYALKRLREKS